MLPEVPPLHLQLEWSRDLRFRAESTSGARADLDGDGEAALSPMEVLLAGLGGCIGSDIVAILTKMRVDLESLRIRLAGDRNEEAPKFFRRILLRVEVSRDVPQNKLERAVELSRQKYCSVLHSLRPDITLEVEVSRS